MRIAIAKPDWGVRGGFEMHIDRLVHHLTGVGHEVVVTGVSGHPERRTLDGHVVSDAEWDTAPEFHTYLSLVERMSRHQIDADLVITTQPGSWAVPHDRKLALFYHQQRVFYDLADLHLRIHGGDRAAHRERAQRVMEADLAHVPTVRRFLVPSATVADRLRRYWGVTDNVMSPYQAGPDPDLVAGADPAQRTPRHALCVSRSEFSKRTDMFVAAAHEDFGTDAVLAGGGGQVGSVRRWAAEKAAGVQVDPEPWMRAPRHERIEVTVPDEPVTIAGRLAHTELRALYRDAVCMVAPAYDEDYGHTPIEAFRHGVPVIVCSDGGGLVEFIDPGVNGLVVEPEPAAIAAAVRRLVEDPELATRMGRAGAELGAEFTWERAFAQLDEAIDATMEVAP